MQDIPTGWEKACREDLRISPDSLPWIIFYDEVRACHVRPEPNLLPRDRSTKHSLGFAGRSYPIFEVDNNAKLWVPGRAPMDLKPQGIAMSYNGDAKVFFILATPDFVAKSVSTVLTSNLAGSLQEPRFMN
jgi:hypothetical protein